MTATGEACMHAFPSCCSRQQTQAAYKNDIKPTCCKEHFTDIGEFVNHSHKVLLKHLRMPLVGAKQNWCKLLFLFPSKIVLLLLKDLDVTTQTISTIPLTPTPNSCAGKSC